MQFYKGTMPKKIRELKAILLKAGFTYTPGKGSHSEWQHPLLERPIIIPAKTLTTPRSISKIDNGSTPRNQGSKR
jgi:predicted RNA binding protein YcfA (HicA-like mRNA interferase family)